MSPAANIHDLPFTVQLAIDSLEYTKGPANISATETSLTPRIRQLRRFYADQITHDISDKIYMLLGSFTHKILEATARELTKDNQTHTLEAITLTLEDYTSGRITSQQLPHLLETRVWDAVKRTALEDHHVMIEHRLFAEVNGWTISGQMDLFSIDEGHIDDYKVCSVWNHILGTKKDWEVQQNIYKYLLWRNGHEVKTATIQAIFRDHMKSKARWDPKYPAKQWMQYPVNLWAINEIEDYLGDRIEIHKQAETVEDPEDLPICGAEDRWASGTSWAVTKATRQRAIKLFDSRTEADIWIEKNRKPGEVLSIEHRPGEDRRCIGNYCEVAEFCSHGRQVRAAIKEGSG